MSPSASPTWLPTTSPTTDRDTCLAHRMQSRATILDTGDTSEHHRSGHVLWPHQNTWYDTMLEHIQIITNQYTSYQITYQITSQQSRHNESPTPHWEDDLGMLMAKSAREKSLSLMSSCFFTSASPAPSVVVSGTISPTVLDVNSESVLDRGHPFPRI